MRIDIGGDKMKINHELRMNPALARQDVRSNREANNRFGDVLLKQDSKMQSEQLTRLLGDISTAGDRVAKSRSLRELARFKRLVKRFMEETVQYGIETKNAHTWNRFGEGLRLKIVETIDENLVQLAEDLLNEEKETIDLLDKIGEIKGLLINLYM